MQEMPPQPQATPFPFFAVALLLVFLTGCTTTQSTFRFQNIAKGDIDLVADAHLHQTNELLNKLLTKLYKRNPAELKKDPTATIASRRNMIFNGQGSLCFEELHEKRDIEAMNLTFAEDFTGDRVFALMVGLTSMLRKAYNDKSEFFILDTLNEQKLYDSARNIEILVWRLSNKHASNGELFLLSNGLTEDAKNLSFERLFGKMIAIQDMMAEITADKSNRTINRMVQSLATATFIPISAGF